jgi:hypothetical protein
MKNKIQKLLVYFIICYASLLASQDWGDGVPLNTPRQGAASVVMGNYIYVMGGKSLNNNTLKTVERFNLNTRIWETNIDSFSTPRMNAAAIVFNDSIFLAGGRDDSGEVIDEVEVYDLAQNSWHSAQAMRREREGHALVSFNNRIYAIGGQGSGYDLEEEIEWYDTTDGEWHEANFQMEHPRVAFFSAVYSDTFYMCGGFYYGPTDNSFIKPPQTLNWIPGPSMATKRGGGASALLGNRLFMMGGETQSGITDSVEVYYMSSYYIMPGTNLPIARMGMTAVTLKDTIYVIGGITAQSNGQPTTLVQVYPGGPVGVFPSENPALLIEDARLVGYPNPFNGRVELKFEIPNRSHIDLSVFDLQGRKVKQLVNEQLSRGSHLTSWNGEDQQNRKVASGIYFAVLRGNGFHQTFKLFYVK